VNGRGKLQLYGMKAAFDEIMATAVKRQPEPQRIIGDLLTAEISEKQARSIRYQLTISKLPLAKDLDDFQFDGTPINETLARDLAGGASWPSGAMPFLVGGTSPPRPLNADAPPAEIRALAVPSGLIESARRQSRRMPTLRTISLPALVFGLDKGAALFRHSERKHDALRFEAIADVGCRKRLDALRVEQVDDRARRAGRRHDAEPGSASICGNPASAVVGTSDTAGQPLCRCDREAAHLSGHDLPARERYDVEHHRDVAGDHVLNGRRGAAIRHVVDLDAGEPLELLADDVTGTAIALRRVGQLAGIRF
jgi:hypothetical protein